MDILQVTTSFAQDFERCKLLVKTSKRYVSGTCGHVLIVDQRDMDLFQQLSGNNVFLVPKESLLPAWLKQISFANKWWWSSKSLPVRGWILQQLVKLSVAENMDADAFLFVDSDTTFVRPFDASQLVRKDTHGCDVLRLYRDARKPHFYTSRRYKNWYGFAAKSLKIPSAEALSGAYISQLVTWRKDSLLALLKQLEHHWSMPWQQYFVRHHDFSEYLLYGVYVEEIEDPCKHFFDDRLLCHSSWYHDIDSLPEIEAFLGQIEPHQSAVHIQSNLRIAPAEYEALLTPLYA